MGHKLGNSDIVNILYTTDDPTPVANQVQAVYTTDGGGETYIYFDGTGGFMKPPTSSYLNFTLPIKVDFLPDSNTDTFYLIEKFNSLNNNNEWAMFGTLNPLNIELAWRAGNVLYNNRKTSISDGVRQVYEVVLEGSDAVHYLDGVETARDINANIPTGNTLETYIGRASHTLTRNFKGRVYSIQFGSEVFDLNEGIGGITTGSEGTVLSIVGATWEADNSPKLIWEKP